MPFSVSTFGTIHRNTVYYTLVFTCQEEVLTEAQRHRVVVSNLPVNQGKPPLPLVFTAEAF